MVLSDFCTDIMTSFFYFFAGSWTEAFRGVFVSFSSTLPTPDGVWGYAKGMLLQRMTLCLEEEPPDKAAWPTHILVYSWLFPVLTSYPGTGCFTLISSQGYPKWTNLYPSTSRLELSLAFLQILIFACLGFFSFGWGEMAVVLTAFRAWFMATRIICLSEKNHWFDHLMVTEWLHHSVVLSCLWNSNSYSL